MNDRLSNSGLKRFAYAKDRDEWVTWMRTMRLNHRISTAPGKRRVTITRVYGGRQRPFDYANLVGGSKGLVDAMAIEGLIEGDDPSRLEDHYQQVQGKPIGVTITIEVLA